VSNQLEELVKFLPKEVLHDFTSSVLSNLFPILNILADVGTNNDHQKEHFLNTFPNTLRVLLNTHYTFLECNRILPGEHYNNQAALKWYVLPKTLPLKSHPTQQKPPLLNTIYPSGVKCNIINKKTILDIEN